MSLVNDALKRAKDAQQKGPPSAPAPQLRPAEAAPAEKRGMGMTVPLVIAVIAIAGLLFVWKNRHPAAAREAAAETKPAAPVNAAPATKLPVQSVAVSTPAPAAPATAATPAPVASPPAPLLKLQAIFFAPGRSTAIISGKTVRVGNTFKGYRVTAITETSATLVSNTETNVMTLEQ
jgi:MSHA biogenesis protein MshK